MDQYDATSPRINDSPLILSYKGVFATRSSFYRISKYGHYLDKLYRISYFGIGSHEADILPGVVNATLLHQTSIDGKPKSYQMVGDDANDSVVLSLSNAGMFFRDLITDGIIWTDKASTKAMVGSMLNSAINEITGVDMRIKNKAVISRALTDASKDIIGLIGEVYKGLAYNLYGIILLGDYDADLTKYASVFYLDELKYKSEKRTELPAHLQAVKVKSAEFVLDVVLDNLNVKDGTVLVTDENSIGELVRIADVVAESGYLAEKVGIEFIQNEYTWAADLSRKETSIAHYLLYRDSRKYREQINSIINEYIDSRLARRQTIVESLGRLIKDVTESISVDRYMSADKFLDALKDGALNFNKVSDYVAKVETLPAVSKSMKKVEIDFNHAVTGEDSKTILSLLDSLYEDFTIWNEQVRIDDLSEEGVKVYNDALIVEYLLGREISESKLAAEIRYEEFFNNTTSIEGSIVSLVDVVHETNSNTSVIDHVSANPITKSDTRIENEVLLRKTVTREFTVLNDDHHGDLWSETSVFIGVGIEKELFGELTNAPNVLMPEKTLFVDAEMTDDEQVLTYRPEFEVFGELTSEPKELVPDKEVEFWGELINEDEPNVTSFEYEFFGELTSEPTELQQDVYIESFGKKLYQDGAKVESEYEIAVFGCANNNLKYRRRPDLEPDKQPEDPLFEWVCTEGYVCDDWLIVPLKDFNFENPEQDGFYDPVTLEPYYPTGQEDANGDPYVLPPYSVLNEPISNGVDVGGKQPMSINPCNLYSFIEYIVKIYDAYKSRFHASSPIDTVSRVMNMLFDQVQKLVSEWDETKDYTPDELWRIYRFIRWMALGITNRFYRVKIVYTYGDFIESFEVYPFSSLIKTEGVARKSVSPYGWVMEGHPIISAQQNKISMEFDVPRKSRSSTISFELGNIVPDRPDRLEEGGVLFHENFEGVPDNFKLKGSGWVPISTQGGVSLAVEDPARIKTYRTNTFNVPSTAVNPSIRFNYGIDTNMDTELILKRSDGTVVWNSVGVVGYGQANLNQISEGDYYFEVNVPQAESNSLTDILFTAQRIQDEWVKVGYLTEWKVVGDTIYEEENTSGVALVVNQQWAKDDEYEFECEFYTKEDQSLYWAYDWIGFVFNYKDEKNYYLVGAWSDLDKGAYSGVRRVVDGNMGAGLSNPMWHFSRDFRWRFNTWHKMRVVVKGSTFTIYIDGEKYLEVTDSYGWGYGASGLAAWSNPYSTFRNFKYKGKPRFNAFIDNVTVEATGIYTPVGKPKYAIDFYLDGEITPRLPNYSEEAKRAFSFPIMIGEHKAKWVFKKLSDENSIAQDASFIDNIKIKGIKAIDAEVVEEFISCGGHLAVKLLIENLLEYYRRHHQGCKGERNIWIIE